jgi:hypothetical protein
MGCGCGKGAAAAVHYDVYNKEGLLVSNPEQPVTTEIGARMLLARYPGGRFRSRPATEPAEVASSAS